MQNDICAFTMTYRIISLVSNLCPFCDSRHRSPECHEHDRHCKVGRRSYVEDDFINQLMKGYDITPIFKQSQIKDSPWFQVLLCSTPPVMIQLNEHMFQMGWNHQWWSLKRVCLRIWITTSHLRLHAHRNLRRFLYQVIWNVEIVFSCIYVAAIYMIVFPVFLFFPCFL